MGSIFKKFGWRNRLGFILQIHKSIPLAWKLLLDQRVMLKEKLWFIVPVALYLALPIDAILDYIPLLGQIDDLAVILFFFDRFMSRVPEDIIRSHLKPVNVRYDK
ncbi:MAG: YkvA family protein [Clostridia bacterium]|nr:YkvA family protein [Clostridia bacterium]